MYPLKKGKLTMQCDEMCSFVGNKGNKQWIWLALDVETREIVGVHTAPNKESDNFGILCQVFTDSGRSLTRIFTCSASQACW